MPSAYPWPVATDHRDGRQLRGHHREPDRPPRQVAAGEEIALELVRVFAETDTVPDDPHQVETDDRPVDRRHSVREVPLEQVEAGEDDHPHHHDFHIGSLHRGHNCFTRARRLASARPSRSRCSVHAARSRSSMRCDSANARVVSFGAGPPHVIRTFTKCAGLMIRCRSASL